MSQAAGPQPADRTQAPLFDDVAPVQPVIAGYVIDRLLGRGGMGEVWLARHEALDRLVAIKVLRGDYARSPGYCERFLREARAAAKVNHPRVVGIHDAGKAGDLLYLAMEYMPGGDAHALLREGGLEEAEALRLIVATAEGLQAIHDAGLVHRDLKPENLFLDAEGLPKIGDLGLARMAMGDDRMTATGSVVGTPAYMSPEQAKGLGEIDARSDLYSLAATAFALLIGRPPYLGSSPWATVAQVLNDPPPDPRTLKATVSPAVAETILAGLAKDPVARPASARIFADLLRGLETPSLPPPPPPPARIAPPRGSVPPPSSAAATVVTAKVRGILSRPALAWIGGMILFGLVVIVVATLAVLGEDEKPEFPVPGTASSSSAKPAPASSDGVAKPPPGTGIGGIFRDMKSNIRGTLRHMMEGTVADVRKDVRRAVERKGVKVTKDVVEGDAAILEGVLPGGDEMRVITRQHQADTVELAIQIGAFGDEARQRVVLDWIRAER